MFIEDENHMLQVAQSFAKICKPPLVIYLSGPLGVGKTVFSRGFLSGLGYTGKVKSPTYTLVEAYQFGSLHVFHFDFYRIHDAEELELIGIREYFNDQSICLLEWPEKGEGKVPPPDITCQIQVENEGRRLKFFSKSDHGKKILESLNK